MNLVITLLTVVLVAVCFLMIFIVLMQRPRQEGLGAAFGSGMTNQMFGAQTTNVLQKATVWMAVMFFVLTLSIAMLMAKQQDTRKLDEGLSSGESTVRGTEESALEGAGFLGAEGSSLIDPSLPSNLDIPVAPPVSDSVLPGTDASVEEAGEASAEGESGDGGEAIEDPVAPVTEESGPEGAGEPVDGSPAVEENGAAEEEAPEGAGAGE
ncbi:MAG TPA: preprotein translocase subunit SecG [Verrucomicrobiales bacterium]|nr:preprotein translocase subunit SecG [Verrucomicrobiales bacterium]